MRRARHRGFVLPAALILLLVLALVTTGALRTSGMEARLSYNEAQHVAAFAGSEAVRRKFEPVLEGWLGAGGVPPGAGGPVPPGFDPEGWTLAPDFGASLATNGDEAGHCATSFHTPGGMPCILRSDARYRHAFVAGAGTAVVLDGEIALFRVRSGPVPDADLSMSSGYDAPDPSAANGGVQVVYYVESRGFAGDDAGGTASAVTAALYRHVVRAPATAGPAIPGADGSESGATIVAGPPAEAYDRLYGDAGYARFRAASVSRRAMALPGSSALPRPRTFDARLFGDGDAHPGGWGTFVAMVGPAKGGGSTLAVEVFDVTDRMRGPEPFVTIAHPDLSGIVTRPAVVVLHPADTVGAADGPSPGSRGDWLLAFAAGARDAPGEASPALLFLYDLARRRMVSGFPRPLPGSAGARPGAPVAVDWDLDFHADSIFVATSGAPDGSAANAVYRIDAPPRGAPPAATRPITGSDAGWADPVRVAGLPDGRSRRVGVSVDAGGQEWVLLGDAADSARVGAVPGPTEPGLVAASEASPGRPEPRLRFANPPGPLPAIAQAQVEPAPPGAAPLTSGEIDWRERSE